MKNWITWLCIAAGTLSAAGIGAQTFPSKTIRVVVTVPPGVTPDITARLLASRMGPGMGQPLVVDNRPGAGGTIGADQVAKSPADGHTLLYAPNPVATMAPHMYSKLPYAPSDLKPVSIVGKLGYVLLANKDAPFSSIKELIEYARARPDGVSYASYGVGTGSHLAMEQLQNDLKLKMLHVPYKSSPTTDLIGGQVQLLFEPYGGAALESVKAGKLKAIGVTLTTRSPALPDTPSISETVPGFESPGWLGFWVPSGTPPAIVKRYEDEIARAVASAEVQERFRALSITPTTIDAKDMADTIARESTYWGALIRRLGIKLD